jgi:hypothetical protein
MKIEHNMIRMNSPPSSYRNNSNKQFKLNKMKIKKLLIIVTILWITTASAQITKGNWMVGGDANYSNSNETDKQGSIITSGNSIKINPNIGYLFFDKFAGGLKLNMNYGVSNGNSSSISYGIGPFMRYYFLKPEKLVNVLAEISYNYNIYKNKGLEPKYAKEYNIKAGPTLFFNSSVALELTANYGSFLAENYNYNKFWIGFGFQIYLKK